MVKRAPLCYPRFHQGNQRVVGDHELFLCLHRRVVQQDNVPALSYPLAMASSVSFRRVLADDIQRMEGC